MLSLHNLRKLTLQQSPKSKVKHGQAGYPKPRCPYTPGSSSDGVVVVQRDAEPLSHATPRHMLEGTSMHASCSKFLGRHEEPPAAARPLNAKEQ